MHIDPELLEAIVREVIQRLLASNADLATSIQCTPPDACATFEHYGRVLSESDLIVCRKQGQRAIRIDAKTIVTPLARDRAKDMGIRILSR